MARSWKCFYGRCTLISYPLFTAKALMQAWYYVNAYKTVHTLGWAFFSVTSTVERTSPPYALCVSLVFCCMLHGRADEFLVISVCLLLSSLHVQEQESASSSASIRLPTAFMSPLVVSCVHRPVALTETNFVTVFLY